MEDEEFDSLLMECTNCRLKFYAPELKVNPLTNELVCQNCTNFPGGRVTVIKDRVVQKKKAQVTALSKPAVATTPKKEDTLNIPPGYVAYLCENCDYFFTRKVGKFNGICPYCSKEKVRTLKRK